MNYMKEVAQLLGVDIGEEFKVDLDGVVYHKNFYFTEYSLFAVGNDRPEVGVLNYLLNGKYKVIKLPKPVLTDEEKEYLSYVIKPFREDVLKISKFKSKVLNNKEVIGFETPNGFMIFPPFEKDKMYKNMELNKGYTLDDLGL